MTFSRWRAVVAFMLLALAGGALATAIVLLRGKSPLAPAMARVAHDAALRSEPRESGAALADLTAGTTVDLIGRSQDSQWLFVSPVGRAELTGWLPAGAVRAVDNLARLTRIDSSPDATTTLPAGAHSAARADLVLHSAGAKHDRLFVLIANEGNADFNGPIEVTVNDGTPRRVDAGKPLRPGEALEAVLNTEYVQRRARVLIAVLTPDGADAALDNNRLHVVVAPDEPIDLELVGATFDPGDGRLVVNVRNAGPIPLVGVLSISVRETAPSTRLVLTSDVELDAAQGAVQRIELPPQGRIDMPRVTVSISTDAIADANPANDSYPR
jgi:hypothetical protein